MSFPKGNFDLKKGKKLKIIDEIVCEKSRNVLCSSESYKKPP